ncbi:hypothetical protein [Azospirillum brasilense]|uniref:hypothetical protein n=1 Tax=Azospirillum brasilense TaxID=192 RepID=UPI00157B41D4|nr:hypothetical protein [Azospirillum brasilense]NUB30537.1 hypothetical protein [Azospirillum brasilense]
MSFEKTSFEEFDERFERLFPTSNDVTLVVLKGHLLMEEIVNGFMVDLLANPTAIDVDQFRFAQRLRLVRALLPVRHVDALLDSAEKLNTLRNKIAPKI